MGTLTRFLVAPPLKSGVTYLLCIASVGTVASLHAYVDIYRNYKISSDFKKIQKQNVFQDILSNFDFWTPHPPAQAKRLTGPGVVRHNSGTHSCLDCFCLMVDD